MSLCCVYLTTPITQVPTGLSHWSCTSLVANDRFLLKCRGFEPLAYCLLVLFSLFLQGLSESRLEKSQSLLHCFKSTKGKERMPVELHCGAASDHKIQTSACPVSCSIIKSLNNLTFPRDIAKYKKIYYPHVFIKIILSAFQ